MTSLGISFAGIYKLVIIGCIFVFISISLIEKFLSPFHWSKVGLHPVWIIFALLAAGTWFGYGILLALPVTTARCYYVSSLIGT
jgi:predicted PurR-regulated permease PerM